ncbi:MAG: two-component system sensor histidine kinase CreC [Nitrospira sp.]|nr:two-component system sensor histidine kinase CreC [Nitrospira sp.]
MNLTARIFLGFFLVMAVGAYFTMHVALDELKPMVRQSTEDTLIEAANLLATVVKEDVKAGRINSSAFAASLRDSGGRALSADIWGVAKIRSSYRIYITDGNGIVIFDTDNRDVGKDYSQWRDVYLTLRGKYGARSSRTDSDDEASSVMHVAAPIKDGDRIIGVLTVAKPNASVQPFIDRGKKKLLRSGLAVLVVSLLVGLGLSFWLTWSLRQLSQYALDVSRGQRVSLPSVSGTELVDLGGAIEMMRTKLEGKEYVEHYVHTLTHELKSPLSAIQGASELLGEEMSVEERTRFLANIRDEAARMQSIVERLLDLAMVERRQSLQNMESIDMRALAQDVLERKRAEISAKQVSATNDVPEALSVVGERFLLRQALINLVDNALAFTPAGGMLAISGRIERGWRQVMLRDSGVGIPDYAVDRVFERFYSLPRPDTGKKGTGIGLSFVHEVAVLHGGTIMLRNQPEGGTLATLRFPA